MIAQRMRVVLGLLTSTGTKGQAVGLGLFFLSSLSVIMLEREEKVPLWKENLGAAGAGTGHPLRWAEGPWGHSQPSPLLWSRMGPWAWCAWGASRLPRITWELKPSQRGAQLGESTVNSSAAAGFSSPVPSRLLTQGVGTKLSRCRRLTSWPILLFT